MRQWNYVEDITHEEHSEAKIHQNYQLFNDIRSDFYGSLPFIHGFPAATGIGIENGGFALQAIAIIGDVTIFSVDNPLQQNAHQYSDSILVGAPCAVQNKLSKPKFERAKVVISDRFGFLAVSGTAAIIGEKTVFENDVVNQTYATVQNITRLVAFENLFANKPIVDCKLQLLNVRVYLKRSSDYALVKQICDRYFENTASIFVKSDICRKNLLVEIEAHYTLLR